MDMHTGEHVPNRRCSMFLSPTVAFFLNIHIVNWLYVDAIRYALDNLLSFRLFCVSIKDHHQMIVFFSIWPLIPILLITADTQRVITLLVVLLVETYTRATRVRRFKDLTDCVAAFHNARRAFSSRIENSLRQTIKMSRFMHVTPRHGHLSVSLPRNDAPPYRINIIVFLDLGIADLAVASRFFSLFSPLSPSLSFCPSNCSLDLHVHREPANRKSAHLRRTSAKRSCRFRFCI